MRHCGLAALILMAGCAGEGAPSNEEKLIAECEQWLKERLRAPSSYKRVSATAAIPDEAESRQSVFIEYDAVNAFNAPLREIAQCDFPYGPEEAKLRPITSHERNAIAETEALFPDLGDNGLSEPDCCMHRYGAKVR